MELYDRIAARVAQDRLAILGTLSVQPDDPVPSNTQTILLLGPASSAFWPHVTADPVFQRTAAHPLDTWSDHRITAIARELGGTAVFPFGGPPWPPFIAWAKRSGRAWQSPVGLLVHDTTGLMISYRGALAMPERVVAPAPPASAPCLDCHQPCRTACPVSALGGDGYDTAACHSYLDTDAGQACMTTGCAVRRACPVSAGSGRLPAQSAFHMRSFHP